jgi:hypothetical protein
MAKRKERALAQKGTASKRGKAGKKVKSAPRKSAKRTRAKVSAKKTARGVASKTKAKKPGIKPRARQAAPKKVGPRPTKSSRRAATATEETVIVDIVEEAVPGVVVVTEFESVRTSGPEAPSPRPEGEESPDLA